MLKFEYNCIKSEALLLAAVTLGCCVSAPQGSVQGGVQGGAQVPPGVPHSTAPPAGVGGVRRFNNEYTRGRGYRDWRTRGDPTLINSLWRSRQPLGIRKQLG
ncbi:Type I restriction-modification system, S subunit [Operophtera brumata]|uniref:Type I restriction-modification system, S subunit n=1 Tax=Operophtera brumata TaxID=104452 RepID=A0A0L7L8L9_OPEBR|nr:Type I restriction-modification system, S subunit [Operophtera brumata]